MEESKESNEGISGDVERERTPEAVEAPVEGSTIATEKDSAPSIQKSESSASSDATIESLQPIKSKDEEENEDDRAIKETDWSSSEEEAAAVDVPREIGSPSPPRSGALQPHGDDGDDVSISDTIVTMTAQDVEICQQLDLEYDRALEEREIGYNARYQSVRQSACFSISFMIMFLCGGVAYFTHYAQWEVRDALFFSVYTVTTVGYGLDSRVPDADQFQLFIIFFIFVGIATLTIMVAQVYQCVALEATRAQHARDKARIVQSARDEATDAMAMHDKDESNGSASTSNSSTMMEYGLEMSVRTIEQTKVFFRESEWGRGASVIFPLGGLVLLGAAFVGPIEGWGFVESIYFSCVSLTTVGYGRYVPQEPASVWFCIVWLPFSVGFMSIYLGNVATFYIRLSDTNIRRLERHMRRRIQASKDAAAKERALARTRAYRGVLDPSVQLGTTDTEGMKDLQKQQQSNRRKPKGFESLPEHDQDALFGSPGANYGEMRRQKILQNSSFREEESVHDELAPPEQTMQTMRDILRTVHANVGRAGLGGGSLQEQELMSVRSTKLQTIPSLRQSNSVSRKPSFALRVLVQERFADIIATDIAGFQSHVEIKNNTLSVTIDTLKQTAEKWRVPRRARKAFRAVAFEALYFVGEHGLVTRGADALYDLSPFEFHGLFSPLLAAMGDAETMESWLQRTNVLADVDLRKPRTFQ